MADAQWTIEGTREAMDILFKDAVAAEDWEVFLFSNNFTITDATVKSDLTEITTNGGEKKTLTKANWAAATDADPIVSRYNGATGVVWDVTGALTVYGWGIVGATSGKLFMAQNWGVNTFGDGNEIKIQPFDVKLDIPE